MSLLKPLKRIEADGGIVLSGTDVSRMPKAAVAGG